MRDAVVHELVDVAGHVRRARADLRGRDARDAGPVAPETAPKSTKKLPTASSRGDDARRRRQTSQLESRAGTDHGHHFTIWFRHVRDARVEAHLALVLFFEGSKLRTPGTVGAAAEEPRFYYIC